MRNSSIYRLLVLVGVLAFGLWPVQSVGQGARAVFVAIPELDANGRLTGSLAKANFELQGTVPIAHTLSFPTAIVCAPGNVLYVAEFYRRSLADQPNDTPETRIVKYAANGDRGEVVATIPEAFVVGLALSEGGELFAGTGVFPGIVEFSGVWKARPGGAATQIVKPSDLQELLDLLETVVNPRDPEVRQLALVPSEPAGRPFAGDLLFTAGAGTLLNWNAYRVSTGGGTPQKLPLPGAWHGVASHPAGPVVLADFEAGRIVQLSEDLARTTPFAELIEPFQLAVDGEGTVFVTTQAFEFDNVPATGKKHATLWRIDRFGRLPVGAEGAWGVAVCD